MQEVLQVFAFIILAIVVDVFAFCLVVYLTCDGEVTIHIHNDDDDASRNRKVEGD